MEPNYEEERKSMVENQLKSREIKNPGVLNEMMRVPRHMFVPENLRCHSYNDEPLPIGEGQTISQPYIVAYMTESLHLEGQEKVLEIGTGSGYQTAILAGLSRIVFTVEMIASLSHRAQEVLNDLGYTNVYFKIGDGIEGWEENAPFDAIIVTAAPKQIPETLKQQLNKGGRMIIPVGEIYQDLYFLVKYNHSTKKKKLLPVRFVPLISNRKG